MASKAFLENSSNPSAALPIRVGTAAALSIYFILAGRLKASGGRFKQSRSRETGRESQRSSRFEPPDEPKKVCGEQESLVLIQDKKKNKKPKSRRDHRSYRLRHLFHFPPSIIILHGRPPPQRSAPPPVVRSRRPVKEVYLERCLIFLLFLCNLRSLFFFHFHLILACAFFHGLDLCAMVTVLLLPSRESRVEREKKKS